MFSLEYRGVDGSTWPLVVPLAEPSGVWMPEEGIDGLVSEGDDQVVESLSAGQRLTGVAVGAMTGTLTVNVRADATRKPSQVYRAFRKAWSRFDDGELVYTDDERTLSAFVRLAEWIGPIPTDQDNVSDTTVEISVVADDGAWWGPVHNGTGTVTVTNRGHVPVWPSITWNGAGGRVVLPSGLGGTLPAVASPKTLDLHPDESLAVFTTAGVLDRLVWDQVCESGLLPEGVPVGKSKTYMLPDGATLGWREAVDAPW